MPIELLFASKPPAGCWFSDDTSKPREASGRNCRLAYTLGRRLLGRSFHEPERPKVDRAEVGPSNRRRCIRRISRYARTGYEAQSGAGEASGGIGVLERADAAISRRLNALTAFTCFGADTRLGTRRNDRGKPRSWSKLSARRFPSRYNEPCESIWPDL
jgi:hypothetical protein